VCCSIPAAHSHQLGGGGYQPKAALGTLPSIQHFSSAGKPTTSKQQEASMQLPLDLVAAAMKLKVGLVYTLHGSTNV